MEFGLGVNFRPILDGSGDGLAEVLALLEAGVVAALSSSFSSSPNDRRPFAAFFFLRGRSARRVTALYFSS